MRRILVFLTSAAALLCNLPAFAQTSVTSLNCVSNVVCSPSGGPTPSVATTNAPTFTGTVTANSTQSTNDASLTWTNPPFGYNQTDNSPMENSGGCEAAECWVSPIFLAKVVETNDSIQTPVYDWVNENSIYNFAQHFVGSGTNCGMPALYTSASFSIPALYSSVNVDLANTVTGCGSPSTSAIIPTIWSAGPGTYSLEASVPVGITDGTHTIAALLNIGSGSAANCMSSCYVNVTVQAYGSNTSSGNTMGSPAVIGGGITTIGMVPVVTTGAASTANEIYGENLQVGTNNTNGIVPALEGAEWDIIQGATCPVGDSACTVTASFLSGTNYNYADPPYSAGLDMLQLGTGGGDVAYDARGEWLTGFDCAQAQFACFMAGGSTFGSTPASMTYGMFLAPDSLATSSTNYKSAILGFGASTWNGSAPVEQDWGLSVNTSGNFQISVPSTAVGFTLTGAGLGAFAGGITTAFNAGSAAGLRNGLGSVNGFGSNASGGGAETDIYSGAADGITAAFYYNSGATATVSSYITNAGTYVNASDGRLKHDIKDVSYGLDAIMRLNPRRFVWNGSDKTDLGFIAQEVRPVIPEIVTSMDKEGQLGINYAGIEPVLVRAIQQQEAEIKALQLEIAALEAKQQ